MTTPIKRLPAPDGLVLDGVAQAQDVVLLGKSASIAETAAMMRGYRRHMRQITAFAGDILGNRRRPLP